MPEVTTTSPTLMSDVPRTYSSRSDSSPVPMATPWARVRSTRAPTAALRSMSSCTLAARALGTMTRPTTPSGDSTAMSGRSPALVPLPSVTVRKSGVAEAAMTSAAVVSSSTRPRRSSRRVSSVLRCASARSCCNRICVSASCWRRRWFSSRMPRRSTYPLHSELTASTAPAPPRCNSATRPKATACSTGMPDFDVTCAEIRMMCATTTSTNRMALPPRRCSSTGMDISVGLCHRGTEDTELPAVSRDGCGRATGAAAKPRRGATTRATARASGTRSRLLPSRVLSPHPPAATRPAPVARPSPPSAPCLCGQCPSQARSSAAG